MVDGVVTVITGARVSLIKVLEALEPVLPASSVCEAIRLRTPSGTELRSRDFDQVLAAQVAVEEMEPVRLTVREFSEQEPLTK